MGIIIQDATGSGYGAKVDAENRLRVSAVSEIAELHNNINDKKYFALSFDGIDPVGADDYFVYIKNTGSKDLHITDFRISSTVAGAVEIHEVTGTPSFTAGTDITPLNRTVGNAGTLTGTFKTDTDTTGLTSGGVFHYMKIPVVNTDYQLRYSGHLILPQGQAIALLWDTSTGVLSGSISIYEDQGIID